jgi:hypothetical protein
MKRIYSNNLYSNFIVNFKNIQTSLYKQENGLVVGRPYQLPAKGRGIIAIKI